MRVRTSLVAVCLSIAIWSAVPLSAAVRRAKEPVPDRYIVTFRDSVTDVDAAARNLARKYNATLLTVWSQTIRGAYVAMKDADAVRLSLDPAVAAVEEDGYVHPSATPPTQPTNTLAVPPGESVPLPTHPLWHLTQIANRLPASNAAATKVYQQPYDGSTIRVYVIDSGVAQDHPQFAEKRDPQTGNVILEAAKFEPTADEPARHPESLQHPSVPYKDPIPPDNFGGVPCGGRANMDSLDFVTVHGTAVAGFVNGHDLGVAKGATVVPVKIVSCGPGGVGHRSVAMLISGFEWVSEHATKPAVVNVSHFESVENCTVCLGNPELSALEQSVVAVLDRGIPVITSANNDPGDACNTTPARLSIRGKLLKNRLNRDDGVITVGAATHDALAWSGSKAGQCVDIWAPGAELATAEAAAGFTFVQKPVLAGDERRSGTSYAAPMVAAAVARMMQEDPAWFSTDTVKRVWERLAANATIPSTPIAAEPSPNLLLYLAGVTFTKPISLQWQNSTATLSVEVLGGNVTYQWFKNNAVVGGATSSQHTVTVPAGAGEYYVRVTRGAFTAESNRVTVPATPPAAKLEIVAQPVTQWVTAPAGSTEVSTDQLTATVRSAPGFGYTASWLRLPGRFTAQSGTSNGGESTFRFTGPVSFAESFVLEASAKISETRTETISTEPASIRPCFPFTPQLSHAPRYDAFIGDQTTEKQLRRPAGSQSVLWLFGPSETQLAPLPAPGSPLYERSSELVPLQPGWYQARVGNDCSSGTTNAVNIKNVCFFGILGRLNGARRSDFGVTFVQENGTEVGVSTLNASVAAGDVTLAIDVDGEDQYPRNLRVVWDGGTQVDHYTGVKDVNNLSSYRATVSCNRTVVADVIDETDASAKCIRRMIFNLMAIGAPADCCMLKVPSVPEFEAGTGSFKVDVTTEPEGCNVAWTATATSEGNFITIANPTGSGKGFFTINVTANSGPARQGIVKVSTATRTVEIIVRQKAGVAECTIPQRSFYTLAGCPLARADARPMTTVRPNQKVIIVPVMWSADGSQLLGSREFELEWRYDGKVVRDQWLLEFVPQQTTNVTLKVTRISDRHCEIISILVRTAGETCSPMCEVKPCKQRAVRCIRSSTQTCTGPLSIQPGDAVALEAPTDTSTWYEWHRQPLSGAEEIFGSSRQITVRPLVDTEYWVRYAEGAETVESDRFYIAVQDNSGPIRVEPRTQIVPAGAEARMTVVFDNPPLSYHDYTFEWHLGQPGDSYSPIVGNQRELTRTNMGHDSNFWCKVTGPGVNLTLLATVGVSCNTSIGGKLMAWPSTMISKTTERPFIWATSTGKLLRFRWLYRLPEESLWRVFQTYGSSTWINPTAKKTLYSAEVSDACGNTTTLPELAVHLCIPTIDQQPQNVVVPENSTATLRIGVSPAVAGEPVSVYWHEWEDHFSQYPKGNGSAEYTTPLITPGTKTYYAIVSGNCDGTPGSVRSEYVTVSTCRSPTVTPSPDSNLTQSTQTASIYVGAAGEELTYQWFIGQSGNTSQPLEGETDPTLIVRPNVTTKYWCRVLSRGVCATNSPAITVNICYPSPITVQPAGQRIFRGQRATLSVTVSPSATATATYKWYQCVNGTCTEISGATSASYTTPELSSAVSYHVVVGVGACTWTSSAAAITFCEYDAVIGVPAPNNIAHGGSVTLRLSSAIASAPGKSVTWYRGPSGDRTVRVNGPSSSDSVFISNITETRKYWADVDVGGCVSRTMDYDVKVCVPAITTQPQGATIRSGQTAPLTAATTPIAGQTLQWYIGAPGDVTRPVSGATSASFTTPALTATTSYWLRVTGTCGVNADSTAATVTVCTPPSISSITPTRYIRSGTATSHSVTATGANLTYQWYAGNPGNVASPVAGQTQATLSVSPTATTTYWVRVFSEGLCSIDSAAMIVDVCTDPSITTQPASVTIKSGQSATLTVASSTAGVTYQWFNGNNTPISGATNPTLTVTPAADSQYYVRVTRNACTVTSATATVTVCTLAPTVGPARNTTYQESVTLTASAAGSRVGSASAHYTWYRGTGANAVVFNSGTGMTQRTVNPATTTQYWVRVSDGTCTADSAAVSVNVCIPQITLHPVGTLIQQNQTAQLSVSTTNIAGQTFQWYIGVPGDVTRPVLGATAATYTTTPLTATTTYWVRVTGPAPCGNTTDSTAATVSVCAPANISAVTPTRYIRSGGSTTLQVWATGSNLTYQWYAGAPGNTSSPVSGATLDSVNVSPTATTTYWVRILADGLCVKDSGAMAVDVCSDPSITTQPATTTIASGQSATLSVVSPTAGVTYQWFNGNNTPISGATGSSITVTPSADAQYYVRLTRNACSINSATATVKVCTLSASVSGGISTASGQAVTLSAALTNSRVARENATYTWYRHTGASATVFASGVGLWQRSVNPTSTTAYWVRVDDGACTADSGTTTVTVCIPTITSPPQDAGIARGQSTTLSVSASGAPLQYQWFSVDAAGTHQLISGATSSSITVSPLVTTGYWVRVMGCTNRDSAVATVTVCQPPVVTSGPSENGVRIPGATATVSVAATGDNLSYQWYAGATGDTSSPRGTAEYYSFTAQASQYYWVRITGSCGTKDSAAVLHPVSPKITQQPVNASAPPNGTVKLSVTATGTSLTYQWYRGTSGNTSDPITGETSSTYTTPPISGTTSYWCKITSMGVPSAAAYTQTATVSLCTGPPIRYARATYNQANNWYVTMYIDSSANGQVRYEWYIGVPGDVSQSTRQFTESYYTYIHVTTPQTWWCRVWYLNNSCYSDSNGAYVYPVE